MKKISRLITILFLVFIIIVSCEKGKVHPIDIFSESKSISGEDIKLDRNVLSDPYFFEVFDSIFVSIDVVNNYILNIVDIKNGNQIGRFLERGKGPNELISTTSLHKKSENSFYVGNDKIFQYNLKELLSDKDYLPRIIYKNNSNRYIGLDVISFSDTLFLSNSFLVSERKFGLVNEKGDIITTQLTYPDNQNISFIFKSLAYEGRIVKHPKKNLFAYAVINTPSFEILELIGDSIKVLKQFNFSDFSFETIQFGGDMNSVVVDENNNYGFLYVKSTSKFIYLLYSGRNEADHRDKVFETPYVLVFDWQGKPITRFILDRDITCFSIGKNDQVLYGLYYDPSPRIVKYYLN